MLADLLPQVAAETQAARHPYRPRPSLAGPERCLRALTYDAFGTPAATLAGRALLIFDDSSWHEELTADWIQRTAYQLHSRQMPVEIPNMFPWLVGQSCVCSQCAHTIHAEHLHGHIDGIFTDLLRVDRLLEHKAINHFAFDRIWKGQWPLDNLTQTALYCAGVQQVNPDITEALLLIKNKNTAQYIELLCRYDVMTDTLTVVDVVRSDGERQTPGFVMERVTQSAVEKFAFVEQHRAANTLPARPFEYGTEFPCGYCPWKEHCWEGYQAEFAALATDQALDQDLVDMAAYYCETRGHITEMEKEKDEVKDKIKAALDAKGIRHGTTSQYAITLSMKARTTWDEGQIPADIVVRAKKQLPYVQLDIRKLKQPQKQEAINGNGH